MKRTQAQQWLSQVRKLGRRCAAGGPCCFASLLRCTLLHCSSWPVPPHCGSARAHLPRLPAALRRHADPSFSSAEAAGGGKKAGGGSSSDSEDSEEEVKLEEFEKRELLRVGGTGWAARLGLVCGATDTVA